MSPSPHIAERLRQVVASFRQETSLQQLFSILIAGLIASVTAVIFAISLASLVYWGELSAYLSTGIGFALLSTAILNGALGLASSLPGMVAIIQEAPVVLLATIAQTIALQMAGATPAATFVTVVVVLGLTAVLTGISAFLLGWFKLGNLVRFVPYPVVGGFLAGTGWLISLGAISLLIDRHVLLTQVLQVFQSAAVLQWLPGCVFGIILLVGQRRFNHVLLLPGLLLGGIVLFYVGLLLTGTSIAEARDAGLILNLSTSGSLLPSLPIADFPQVN